MGRKRKAELEALQPENPESLPNPEHSQLPPLADHPQLLPEAEPTLAKDVNKKKRKNKKKNNKNNNPELPEELLIKAEAEPAEVPAKAEPMPPALLGKAETEPKVLLPEAEPKLENDTSKKERKNKKRKKKNNPLPPEEELLPKADLEIPKAHFPEALSPKAEPEQVPAALLPEAEPTLENDTNKKERKKKKRKKKNNPLPPEGELLPKADLEIPKALFPEAISPKAEPEPAALLPKAEPEPASLLPKTEPPALVTEVPSPKAEPTETEPVGEPIVIYCDAEGKPIFDAQIVDAQIALEIKQALLEKEELDSEKGTSKKRKNRDTDTDTIPPVEEPKQVDAPKYVEICVICRKKGHSIPVCPELKDICSTATHQEVNCSPQAKKKRRRKISGNKATVIQRKLRKKKSGNKASECLQPAQDGLNSSIPVCPEPKDIYSTATHQEVNCPLQAKKKRRKKICGNKATVIRRKRRKKKKSGTEASECLQPSQDVEMKESQEDRLLVTGCALRDDSMAVETSDHKEDESTVKVGSASESQETNVKSKEIQDPEQVNSVV